MEGIFDFVLINFRQKQGSGLLKGDVDFCVISNRLQLATRKSTVRDARLAVAKFRLQFLHASRAARTYGRGFLLLDSTVQRWCATLWFAGSFSHRSRMSSWLVNVVWNVLHSFTLTKFLSWEQTPKNPLSAYRVLLQLAVIM